MSVQIFRVVRQHTQWYVRKKGKTRRARGYRSKDNAVARAMDLANTYRPSQVQIEDSRGQIVAERRFGMAGSG